MDDPMNEAEGHNRMGRYVCSSLVLEATHAEGGCYMTCSRCRSIANHMSFTSESKGRMGR
jgi:hypothetical protein